MAGYWPRSKLRVYGTRRSPGLYKNSPKKENKAIIHIQPY